MTIAQKFHGYWQPLVVLLMIVFSVGFAYHNNSLHTYVESEAVQETWSNTDEPIGKAEDLVKDWDKPVFTLFITGRQHGYIEPCGCITLERQKGGLMRRHRVQTILEDRGWELIPIDAGNQIRRFGQQPVIKLRKTYETLCRVMDYDVIGLGPDDLKLPAVDLAQTMDSAQKQGTKPYTCANAKPLFGEFSRPFQVVERNGKKIGITMILGEEHIAKMDARRVADLQAEMPAQALNKVVPDLLKEKCDMNVLVAFSAPEKCKELAKAFPVFDVLVTAGGAGDPTLQPELIDTGKGKTTSMIQVGVKGMYVGLIGLFEKNGKSQIKYKRVQLDHRYKDTDDVKKLFKEYQEELKDLWLRGALADIKPRPHPSGHTFVGADACADCHEEEYTIWEDGVDGNGGPHFEATEDLEQNPNDDRVWVQRHFDPECMSCHATGWNPQNFYPYASGLIDLDKHDHLTGNGCENCHGPGSKHVEMQNLADRQKLTAAEEALRARVASDMVVTIEESRATACKECHDLDNSPDFLKEGGFDKYWPKIEHGRKAAQKIQDLLEDIVDKKRQINDVFKMREWVVDLKNQSPDQVALVENALNQLGRNPGNPMQIVQEVLDKIEVD